MLQRNGRWRQQAAGRRGYPPLGRPDPGRAGCGTPGRSGDQDGHGAGVVSPGNLAAAGQRRKASAGRKLEVQASDVIWFSSGSPG
jgi:hypothetical protein